MPCHAQVRDFWQDVEAATNERQRAMFQCINRRLEGLSQQIEAAVGEVLDLRLEPVTIAMDPPAAQDFHDSLQNLFAQGTTHTSLISPRQGCAMQGISTSGSPCRLQTPVCYIELPISAQVILHCPTDHFELGWQPGTIPEVLLVMAHVWSCQTNLLVLNVCCGKTGLVGHMHHVQKRQLLKYQTQQVHACHTCLCKELLGANYESTASCVCCSDCWVRCRHQAEVGDPQQAEAAVLHSVGAPLPQRAVPHWTVLCGQASLPPCDRAV